MHSIKKLLKKNVKFEWMEEYDKAFNTAKETLMRDPILYHPNPNEHHVSSKQMSARQHSQVCYYNHTHMMG